MGVPKFFRSLSERYPCLSQLVHEFEVPEIDNLYLDMNGLIHVCSHPNDMDVKFRITEEEIFKLIFRNLEFLFRTIKPLKLFYLAVDGVAPRAKMNQQRGRRFRTAKEAETLEAAANKLGDALPKEPRFDSNCITPGTVFMDRLHQELKFFIANKISTDPLWQGCAVVLSGHETPGEGEHKVMDYIRYLKTQPDYDCNIRHCMYGLDADLIMLGLCTHDPNFCLLREEIIFNKKSRRGITTPEETNFTLLHLSILREYIDIEFKELKNKIPFPYNLENIIDDWVLMGFLVGNDFIPHLPNFHINKGTLLQLYEAYKEVLPTLDGYINENGYLNLPRLRKYLMHIAQFDKDHFEQQYVDFAYLEEKFGGKVKDIREEGMEKQAKKSVALQKQLETWKSRVDELFESDETSGDDDEDEDNDQQMKDQEFDQHKTSYYIEKMEFPNVTDKVLNDQAEGYVRALQWVLHYYYQGCPSWSWYYPHHYAPFVSDVANFGDLDLKFDLGKPFLPFHQLLAVLPPASKTLLPEAYQNLMTSPESPIIDFYPPDFDTDLNGKLQDWEALVLLPFIDEERLLKATESCKDSLTEDEVRRNGYGPMQMFVYTNINQGPYKSTTSKTLLENHASVQSIWCEEIAVAPEAVRVGLLPGYDFDAYVPGFPTLRFVPYTTSLKKAGVRVFDTPARGESVIIHVTKKEINDIKDVAKELLGRIVFVAWPHMLEAKVTSVEDSTIKYSLMDDGTVKESKQVGKKVAHFANQTRTIVSTHYEKRAIELDDVKILVSAACFNGHKFVISPEGLLTHEKTWDSVIKVFPLETTVTNLKLRSSSRKVPTTLEEAYPSGSHAILLSQPNYGALAEVMDSPEDLKKGLIKVKVASRTDPEVDVDRFVGATDDVYMPAFAACSLSGMNRGVFARITGSCFLQKGENNSINVGLNLKFNKKNREVPGYTRRVDGNWLYTDRTIQLVNSYWEAFPKIFEYLNTNSTIDFSLEDIYGIGMGVGEEEKMVKWLKEQPHNSVEPVTCGSQFVSPVGVAQLVDDVASFVPQKMSVVLKVKPTRLYKSELFAGHVSPVPATHQLMDRVVCSRSGFTVPLGLRGFIIGIHKGLESSDEKYTVLFDEEFPSGNSVYGSPPCCFKVSSRSFINISAANRANPLIMLRSLPSRSMDLRPEGSKPWRKSPLQTPSEPSAFVSVGKKAAEHAVRNSPKKILQAPSTTNDLPVNQDKFRDMWMRLGKSEKSNGVPSPANDVKAWEKLQRPEALIQALNINDKKDAMESIPEKSHCSSLMRNFERMGVGLPKYQVHQQGGALMASVTLPTGQTFWGVPCDTKEAALENAALQAMAGLGLTNKAINNVQALMSVPPLMPHHNFPISPMPQQMLHPSKSYQHAQLPMNSHHERSIPTKTFYNAQALHGCNNLQSNDRSRTRGGAPLQPLMPPSQGPLMPGGGLPMPPSNWRVNKSHSGGESSVQGTSKVPFIPLQAIIGQKVTRGMRAPHSKTTAEPPPVETRQTPLANVTANTKKAESPKKDSQLPTANSKTSTKSQEAIESKVKEKKKIKKHTRRLAANLNWRDRE